MSAPHTEETLTMPLENPRSIPAQPQAPAVGRRAVVAGAAVLGSAMVVSGCASPSTTPATAPTADAAPTGNSPTAGGATLGPTSDVPVGGGRIFAAQKVVVTQPTAGSFVGLSAVCTHQGCAVATVEGGTINCPCHGSKYNLDGSVANGPATQPLASVPVTVDGTTLVGPA